MPKVRIPTTRTIIDWPDGRLGRIRIHATLGVSDRNSSPGVRVEISFKREPLRRLFRRSERWYQLRMLLAKEETQSLTKDERKVLDHYRPALHPSQFTLEQWTPDQLLRRWGEDVVCTVADYAQRLKDPHFTKFHGCPPVVPRHGRRLQRLDGYFLGVDYRLSIDREDLRALDALMATDEGARKLLSKVQWYLLPTILIDWALRGRPRGKNAQARQFLMPVVHAALFAANELVVKACTDHQLQARVRETLASDHFGQLVLDGISEDSDAASAMQRRIVMALVDQALRPALTRFRMKPLIGRDIGAVLDPGTRAPLVQLFKDNPNWLMWWGDQLLKPEGHAARLFNLTN